MYQDFRIEIVKQHWLGEKESEYDLCSHGSIRLVIGGQLITSDEIEYGISESALALLRTLENDHSFENPVAERLVFHGCGTVLMIGCPIGIDWSVTHLGGDILINNIARYDAANEEQAIRFPRTEVRVPEEHYNQQVLSFAQEVKSWFERNPRSFYEDSDREQFEAFWEEFNCLLNHHI